MTDTPNRDQLSWTTIRDGVYLGKPQSMTDEECGSLHVRPERYYTIEQLNQISDPDQRAAASRVLLMTSRWTLTDEQRRQIAEGADIELEIVSTGHPPVMLLIGQN